MRKVIFYSVLTAVLIGLGTITLYPLTQKPNNSTKQAQNISPSTPPQLTVLAYTMSNDDQVGGIKRHYCFHQQNKADNVGLYFDISGTGASPQKPAQVHLDLYSLADVAKFVYMGSVDQKFTQDKDTIKLDENSTFPPHLGPGPYTTVISSTGGAGLSPSAKSGFYFYETWKNDRKECAYSKGN